MSVFRSIVFSAVLSGLVTGAAVTVVQQFGTVPLILKAETYEHGEPEAGTTPAVATHEHGPAGHADHDHDAAAWKPADGWQRHAFTAAANILTGIGFALLLAGIYALRGPAVGWHEGLLWGLGGFVVFTVAPGLGLPPELPGVPAAALELRQVWWIVTSTATASGLGLILLRRSPWAAVLGFCLILSPHLIGAPQVAGAHTDVPETLSHQFVVAVTITSLLFWSLLGSLTGMAYRRLATPP